MRSLYLSALITGFLLAGGLTDTNPIQTATAGAYLTRTIGNDALGVNPASLGYYGKPIIFGAAEDGKRDTLGLMEKDTVSASEDSIQNYYSVQLIANPSKKRVKETKITFYGQFGNNIPWAVTKIDTLYKLRVGDFHNRDTVDAFLDTVIGSGFKDAWIVTKNRPLEEPEQIPYFTLTLAGAGLYVGNNAIYPDWINNQLFGGLDLRDPGKKDDFLSVFPADNWNINMAAEINSMSFTLGNFGLSILQPKVLGSGNLPPAIMDVLFEGIKFEQPKDLSALHLSLLAASPISVDYGRQLQLPQLKNIVDRFYAGAGLNLLVGIADMHVDADRLEIITTPDSVLIEGKTTILTNFDLEEFNLPDSPTPALGTGFSLDLGVVADINPLLSVSLSLKDLFGTTTWPERYISENEFSIRLSAEDIDEIKDYNDEQMDSLEQSFTEFDTSYATGSGKTAYPSQFILGGSYRILQDLIVHASFRHFLNNDYLEDITPQLSISVEYEPTPVFPIYCGIGIGGLDGFKWGTGFRLNLGAFQWNTGFGQNGGIFNTSKGMCFSTDFRLIF
ncbi:MAG: DUF5723 family protein [Candidatus Marinimicrobia bacterium]|jgi:hypothetical protein|nr:DUF5723 family protein [Candidatus Neomarinimicrobiota bacterium]|tara:strand:+ start:275 stop:1954 length:1680 start_codon:yes stop_codon:yes gene_type:complete